LTVRFLDFLGEFFLLTDFLAILYHKAAGIDKLPAAKIQFNYLSIFLNNS